MELSGKSVRLKSVKGDKPVEIGGVCEAGPTHGTVGQPVLGVNEKMAT